MFEEDNNFKFLKKVVDVAIRKKKKKKTHS